MSAAQRRPRGRISVPPNAECNRIGPYRSQKPHKPYKGCLVLLYVAYRVSVGMIQIWTRNSAKLINQSVSYAFYSSPFNIHVCHIFPTSKFQHSYSCILLIFYRHQWTACVRNENCGCELWIQHWFHASSSGTPVNNPTTLISPVQSLNYIFVADSSLLRSSANFLTVFSEGQNASPLDAQPETF